jgi:hypothetical protein
MSFTARPLIFSDFLRKLVSKKILPDEAAVGTTVAEPCNDKIGKRVVNRVRLFD